MERDERLDAYVDGELEGPARAAVEAEIAGDPELAREVARRQALKARLSAAYEPVLHEAVPLRLTLAAEAANDPPRARPGWRWWGGMAASLAIGLLVGRMVSPAPGPFGRQNGQLAAQGRIEQVLTRGLAADDGPVRIGLTFQDASGAWCRTFQSEPDGLAGLACRNDGRWAVRTVTAWAPATGVYRTAGADLPAPILSAVDAAAATSPVDAAAERAARDGGWR